jgi:hypothetical protein
MQGLLYVAYVQKFGSRLLTCSNIKWMSKHTNTQNLRTTISTSLSKMCENRSGKMHTNMKK